MIGKIKERIMYSLKRGVIGYCLICGSSTVFYRASNNLRETFKCKVCGSISRNRHLAKVLCIVLGIDEPYSLKKAIKSFPRFKIYEAQASGAIHNYLMNLGGYVYSEFLPNVLPGTLSDKGIRCEDLQRLSFKDNSFDLVITQDVLEHVRDPELAWREIYRVLKPRGYHVFTIPYLENQVTVSRVKLDGEEDIYILPKKFHGDSIREGLVYTDFGYNLIEYLNSVGFNTQIFDTCKTDNDWYGIYWSKVFVSRKA